MHPVRDKPPKRRPSPNKSPTGKNWSEHKPDLKEDFHSCCGYCGAYDGFRHTYYEVDHFIPKSLFEKNENIDYCHYQNLTYSCKFCNNIKSNTWPTNDETLHHYNYEGFIDACDSSYEEHLYREENGRISYNSELGKWITQYGFKFDERHREIELSWSLNRIRCNIDALIEILRDYVPNSEEYLEIENRAMNLSFTYFKLHKKLMAFYDA